LRWRLETQWIGVVALFGKLNFSALRPRFDSGLGRCCVV